METIVMHTADSQHSVSVSDFAKETKGNFLSGFMQAAKTYKVVQVSFDSEPDFALLKAALIAFGTNGVNFPTMPSGFDMDELKAC